MRPASRAAIDGGAGALDDELDALEEQHDRLADLLVADGDDLVEEVLDERRRELPGVLDGDALGNRVAVRLLAGERCARLCLYADDVRAGTDAAQRERDPRGEAAAADRHHDRAEVIDLVCELEADRPLAGDHDWILERVDEGRSGLLGVFERCPHRLFEAVTCELDSGAVVAGRVDLRHRRV